MNIGTLTSPRSPRSVAHQAAPMSPDALNPASPSRDINAIVEDAAKRFDDMDKDLKSLMQDMKDYQASMVQLNENRLKTAKHLESFAGNSPFANFIDPPKLALVGTEVPADSGSVASAPEDEAASDEAEKATSEDDADATAEKEEAKSEATTETEESKKEDVKSVDSIQEPKAKADTEGAKPKADKESFAGVHQSAYNLSKKYHAQYGDYLLGYVDNWERVVSTRINGLLIHYRELQENVQHYNKKVGGLLHKVDRSKSVRHKLAEKLDRNEIKEMGAVEARDTVGEHLYLYIEEVMERAWRDVFPLLLRACRFEADFSAVQANILSSLVAVAENIQVTGEDEGCDIMGRLEDLQKKHPEEVYTEENPFVKLTPLKKKKKQPDEGESVVSEESHDVEQTSEAQPENIEV